MTRTTRRRITDAERRRQRVQAKTARQVFYGSDAADTKAFMRRLEQAGPEGCLAAELFRCQKASTRAKMYRGDYRNLACDRKAEFSRPVVRVAPIQRTIARPMTTMMMEL
jgi:hypothetical protein